MKRFLITLALLSFVNISYGQGQVNFQNFEALTDQNRGFYLFGQFPNGPGAGFTAGLFLVSGGVAAAAPTGTTTFFTDPGAEFLLQPVDVTFPGVPGGATVTLRVRIWETAAGSYDASIWRGESADFSQALGGDPGNGQPPTPPTLLNAPGFVVVPEPSTFALYIAGALVLVFCRRRE